MLNRRHLLRTAAGLAGAGLAGAGLFWPHAAKAAGASAVTGMLDAAAFGLRPDLQHDQSRSLAKAFAAAARAQTTLFVPAGTYLISDLDLPKQLNVVGVPGATRLVLGGGGRLVSARDAVHIELTGLTFDGRNRPLADGARGLLDLVGVDHLVVDNCRILDSGGHGLALERVSGRIERSEVVGAADAGLYSVDAGRLQISGNLVSDCGNGGILVHRWQAADDGTQVVGNRVERIGAQAGGTGQNGNGINIFRANGVTVTANSVADCAFSAIRANGASNIQIGGNTCLRAGETAIYAEFAFEGAVISNNIVDGAANGIAIVNFDAGGRMGVCTGNIVRNLSTKGPYLADPPGFGIGIAVEADCAVTGNVIEKAPRYGINIGWGAFMRNVVATGNVIRQTGTGIGISVVEGTGSAVVSDNLIDGAQHGAIIGHRWSEQATADLAGPAAVQPPRITVARNRVG